MSTADIERDFVLRPKQNEKFRREDGETLLRTVAEETLTSHSFEDACTSSLTDTVAVEIRERLKALQLPHYKYVVQVTIGEQRGQGFNITSQCVWDTDCDGLAKYFYTNNSLWCSMIVFAVFHY